MYILPMRKVRRSDDEMMRMFYVDQHAAEMIKSYDEHLIEKIPKGSLLHVTRETQCPELQRKKCNRVPSRTESKRPKQRRHANFR